MIKLNLAIILMHIIVLLMRSFLEQKGSALLSINSNAVIVVVELKVVHLVGLRIMAVLEIDDLNDAVAMEFLVNSVLTLSTAIWKTIQNNSGARLSPCLTPHPYGILSSSPLILTTTEKLRYSFIVYLIKSLGAPSI